MKSSSISRNLFLALPAIAASLALMPATQAATWTGGGGVDTNWTNAANWGGTPLAATNPLNFASPSPSNNNFTANTTFGAITFTNTTLFNVTGNAITWGGNINANGSARATLGLNIVLPGAAVFGAGSGATLAVTSNISETSSGLFYKTGAGTLTLNGNNSFSGNVWVQSGLLSANTLADIGTNSSLGKGNLVRLGVGVNTATLYYTGTTASTNRQFQIGDAGLAGSGGGTLFNQGSGAITFTAANFNVADAAATAAQKLIISGGSNGTIQGVIGNNGNSQLVNVEKAGGSTWTLSGNSTYTGTTLVSAGTLIVNGNNAAAIGNVTVNTGATLGGSGTLGGNTTISGILAPGNSIGTLIVANDVTWNGSGGNEWKFELGGSNTADLLSITGANSDFLKGSGSTFGFNFMGSTATGTFTLVDWADSANTTFNIGDFSGSNLALGNTIQGFAFNGSSLQVTVVPEPSTWILLALGLTTLVVFRRRRCA